MPLSFSNLLCVNFEWRKGCKFLFVLVLTVGSSTKLAASLSHMGWNEFMLKNARIFKRKYFVPGIWIQYVLCWDFVEVRFIISHFYSQIFVSQQCKSPVLSLKQGKANVKFMPHYLAQTFQKRAVRRVWTLKPPVKMLLLSINTE